MKELSIEQKSQRYDEAIERAKGAHNSAKSDKENGVIHKITEYTIQLTETIFPELKESEDERIRKLLIGVVELYYGNTDEQEKKDCLDWLEKQCGQKPAELPKGEDYGIDGLYAAIDILQKTLGEVDGYQSDDGILTHKCAISAVKELSKQKPAWSEEDERNLDWLTTVCERIHYKSDPQVAPECALILRDWLDSLKDRYTWKPSEIQLETLKELSHDVPTKKGIIEELLKQLKQL